MNKISARVVVDIRDLKQLVIALSQRINSLISQPEANQANIMGQINNLLTALTKGLDTLAPVIQKADDKPLFFRRNLDYGERNDM